MRSCDHFKMSRQNPGIPCPAKNGNARQGEEVKCNEITICGSGLPPVENCAIKTLGGSLPTSWKSFAQSNEGYKIRMEDSIHHLLLTTKKTQNNNTSPQPAMGLCRKALFYITAAPMLCIVAPIAALGMMMFSFMINLCGFGICWGRQTHDFLWDMFNGEKFGGSA